MRTTNPVQSISKDDDGVNLGFRLRFPLCVSSALASSGPLRVVPCDSGLTAACTTAWPMLSHFEWLFHVRAGQAQSDLTLSAPIPLRLYTLPYWSNPPFLIFDIRVLWRSGLSARAPECQKIKNGGLDQYGAKPFQQQQFGTAGVERVKHLWRLSCLQVVPDIRLHDHSCRPINTLPSALYVHVTRIRRSRIFSADKNKGGSDRLASGNPSECGPSQVSKQVNLCSRVLLLAVAVTGVLVEHIFLISVPPKFDVLLNFAHVLAPVGRKSKSNKTTLNVFFRLVEHLYINS